MNEEEKSPDLLQLLPGFPYGSKVIPGDRLGPTNALRKASSEASTETTPIHMLAGPGTYERDGYIFASVVGSVRIISFAEAPALPVETLSAPTADTGIVSVVPTRGAIPATQQVIRPDQTVLARVVRITAQQQVLVEIVANPWGRLIHPVSGGIRHDDVTSHPGPEPPPLTHFFRPGDWIVARVISLGDDAGGWYCLSTAEASLGVIYAVSTRSGQPMIPISHREMECPVTGEKEPRKCARPPKISATNV